eukprot:2842600-Pyramimonas_sp.AAC.1
MLRCAYMCPGADVAEAGGADGGPKTGASGGRGQGQGGGLLAKLPLCRDGGQGKIPPPYGIGVLAEDGGKAKVVVFSQSSLSVETVVKVCRDGDPPPPMV